MLEREFEIYLSVLSRLLRLSPHQKDAIADELRDHLEERLAELMQSGLSRENAIQQALDDFGDVSGLALDFTNVSRTPFRRIAMRTTLVASVVAGLAMLGLFLFTPEPELGTQLVSVVHADQGKAEVTEKPKVVKVDKKSVFLQDKELFPEFLSRETEVSFADTPLSDVCEFLATQHKITIHLERKALESAGIATDTPITLLLAKETLNESTITLEEMLSLILKPLQLGWRVDGDLVIVSTIDELNQHFSTRHYDLSHLQSMGYGLGSLREAMMLAGSGWEADGSGTGTTTTFGDTVSVRQTYQDHRRISRVLAALEQPQRVTDVNIPSNRDRIRTGLQQSGDCKFTDTPLTDAIQFLSVQAGIPILLDTAAFEGAGAATDAPVTLRLIQKPISQMLRLMLKDLQLTTVIRDGVLMVTTTDEAQQQLNWVVYDVGTLVADDQPAHKDAGSRTPSDEQKLVQLQALLLELHSNGWEENGSGSGKIVQLETGVFVIQQTDAMHAEIQSLLAQLHANAGKSKQVAATKPQEQTLVTRAYLVSKEAAADLSDGLKELVAVPSWNQPINGELPAVHVVAAEPQLQEVEGRIVGGPFEVRQPEPAVPAKSEPGKPAPQPQPVKNILVKPRANLVIRQTLENHRAIERFIRNITNDWSMQSYDPHKTSPQGGFSSGGLSRSGGGFY